MYILRLLLILGAVLFILFQRVDVRVTKNEKLTVKINFTVFALVLTEDARRKKPLKSIVGLISNLKGVFKSFKFLLSKSDISLFENQQQYYAFEEKLPLIDVSFHFSLIRMIISAMILLYYIVKNKVKRVI